MTDLLRRILGAPASALACALAALAAGGASGSHPTDPASFAAAVGIKEVFLHAEPGLELWCQDKAVFGVVQKSVALAWKEAATLLPAPAPDADLPFRLVLLETEPEVMAYQKVFATECERIGIAPPPASFFEAAVEGGSGHWSYPPLCLMRTHGMSKDWARSRAVHDLGVLRMARAVSEQSYGVPEVLVEGFGGMLVRRAVDKPVALVSHANAALSETIHGYGVFANIGGILNDSSNHPGNWPSILRDAAKAWRKQELIEPEARIDALLQRTRQTFARADYAYSWAALEFLLDDRYPVGAAAVAARATRGWKPDAAVLENRRELLHKALLALRDPEHRLDDEVERSALLLAYLQKATGEDGPALHAAFLHWLETGLPKK